MAIKIISIEQLKQECSDEDKDGFIMLNGGARSSKTIEYNTNLKLFHILNHIDDTEQMLEEQELSTHSNIAEAIQKGAFYLD
jgi:hypothetical protein